MLNSKTCDQCGNPLEENATQGACPSCLLAMAIPNPQQNRAKGSPGLGQTEEHGGPHSDRFAPLRAEQLAQYFPQLEILSPIGHGGMGSVFLARQLNLDRKVALKVLSPNLSSDPTFAERFTREARTLAKLDHPNIVTVFDFGQAGEYYYLIMELVKGINLRDAIVSNSVTPQQALMIVPQICDALQYAHDTGVVHRDIKPENILVGERNRVKIADFGLAKLLQMSNHDMTLTGTHQVLGTRNYMAPEQIEKPTTVDHRADIYSLGVVFYELLTGELPLGRFSPPSEMAAVGNQLDEVVLRSLEKEPGRRFQQASEIRTAVESLAHDMPPVIPSTSHATGEPSPSINEKPPTSGTEILRLPFNLQKVHGGLSSAEGIASFDGTQLNLEYRIDPLSTGLVKTGNEFFEIDASNIFRARIVRGILSDTLELGGNQLYVFDGFPGSGQGKAKLIFSKRDRMAAGQMADAINAAASAARSDSKTIAPPPRRGTFPPSTKSALAH
ncbi:MAG: serine/threonine-protein kinase, partial [Pirellulaceae bacterium]|nr:serine/threonine-protein kinase [Pirellulaceae bacterium]